MSGCTKCGHPKIEIAGLCERCQSAAERDLARPSGEQARRDGKPRTSCPHPPYTNSSQGWREGWDAIDRAPRFTCPECGHVSHPEPPDTKAFTDGEGLHDRCQSAGCRRPLWVDTVINGAGEVTLIAHIVADSPPTAPPATGTATTPDR